MATGTGPATLAGTLALANAEILAGIVIIEQQFPGTAIIYGGIPHILDPRSSQCSFGSPEQGIMAVAMVQMARFYQLPAYVNVGLTDAKVLDAQAGIEKAASLVLGALAGADTFGHAGICGADQGASLEWLAADNTIMAFVKRLLRGIDTSIEAFAADIIGAVGPGGNFLAEPHTAKHFRNEIWPASALWDRQAWNSWAEEGRHSMADRARLEVRQMLDEPPPPVDESLAREVDRVIRCASRELQ
jgi:trimethylamine--corrinoid protein Co-methyltransferase